MNDTFERVKKVVASYEHNGECVVIHDMDEMLYGDLGLDSLAVVESVMLCEEEFGIDFTDDEITKLVTVGDLVNLIDKKLENTFE